MLIIAGRLTVRESDRDRYVADCVGAVTAARGRGPADGMRQRILAFDIAEHELA
jgi:hypothetical protein